jgi:hypothetical protein
MPERDVPTSRRSRENQTSKLASQEGLCDTRHRLDLPPMQLELIYNRT